MQKPGAFVKLSALATIVFLQLPVPIVVLAALNTTSYLKIPPDGLTLEWFSQILIDPQYLSAIQLSVILAMGSTIMSLLMGVPAAYALYKGRLPVSGAISSFLMGPLIFPAIVIGVAQLQYFALVGLRGSLLVLLVSHVVITVPFIVRSALTSLSGMDPMVEDAARALGATPFETFRLVTLPMIKPGLVAGCIFSIVVSLDNVPVTIFLLKPGDMTLSVLIFTSVEQGVDPRVAAVSTLLIIVTGLLLLLAEKWSGFHRFVG